MCQHEVDMAQHIPPGGNWKDIPEEITDNRLANIRDGGGRTTYYGRLQWDKPSYTINTFFNRVPNGCNLHPLMTKIMSFILSSPPPISLVLHQEAVLFYVL